MERWFSWMLVLILSGCACHMPKEVNIPVSSRMPVPEVPKKPELAIAKLKYDATTEEQLKAFTASFYALADHDNKVTKILESTQASLVAHNQLAASIRK